MGQKKKKFSMPTTVAGIVGFAPDEELDGIKIEPKLFLLVVMVAVILIKIANFVINNR